MSSRILGALGPYIERVLGLEIVPLDVEAGGWKLTRSDDDWSSRGGTFTYETEMVKDWGTPLLVRRDDIYTMPETETLVQVIHQATNAELSYIRGVMLDVAASFLANQSELAKDQLLEALAHEIEQLFTQGLRVSFRSFLSGLEATGDVTPVEGVLIRPFSPSDWPPTREPSISFPGPDLMSCSILEFEGRMEALGQPFDPFKESSYHWQKQHERILRILRLFRVGGILSHMTGTLRTSYLKVPMHGGGTLGALYSSSFSYQVTPNDESALGSLFDFLKDIPPWKNENLTSIDIALARYENAVGPLKPREETLLYAIMGLEALLRKPHEGRQSPINRISLLMDFAGVEDPIAVRDTMDEAYRFRNPFVHGETLKGKDVSRLNEILRLVLDYLRVGILLRIGLKARKKTLLKRLDNVLLLPSERDSLSRKVGSVTERAQISAST